MPEDASPPTSSSPKPKLNPTASTFTPVIKSPAIVSSTPPPAPKPSNPIVSSTYSRSQTPPPKVRSPLSPFSSAFTPSSIPSQSQADDSEDKPKFNPSAPAFIPVVESPPPNSKPPPTGPSAPARTAPPPTAPAALRYAKLQLSPPLGPAAQGRSLPPPPNIGLGIGGGGVADISLRGLPPTTPTGPKSMTPAGTRSITPTGPKAMQIPTGPKAMQTGSKAIPTGPRSMTPTGPRSMTPTGPRTGMLGSKYAPQPTIDLTGLSRPPPIGPAAMVNRPPIAPAAMLVRGLGGPRRNYSYTSRTGSTNGTRTPSDSERSLAGDIREERRDSTATPQNGSLSSIEKAIIDERAENEEELATVSAGTEGTEKTNVEEKKELIEDEYEPEKPQLTEESCEFEEAAVEVRKVEPTIEDTTLQVQELETMDETALVESPQVATNVTNSCHEHDDAHHISEKLPSEQLLQDMPVEQKRPLTPVPQTTPEDSNPQEISLNEEIDNVLADVAVSKPAPQESKDETEEPKAEPSVWSTTETNGIYKESYVIIPVPLNRFTLTGCNSFEYKPDSSTPRPNPNLILTSRKVKSKNRRRGAKAKAIMEAKILPVVSTPDIPEDEQHKEDGAPQKKSKNRQAVVADDCLMEDIESMINNMNSQSSKPASPVDAQQSRVLPVNDLTLPTVSTQNSEVALPAVSEVTLAEKSVVVVVTDVPAEESKSSEAIQTQDEPKRSPATLEEHDHEREHDGGVKLDLLVDASANASNSNAVAEVPYIEATTEEAMVNKPEVDTAIDAASVEVVHEETARATDQPSLPTLEAKVPPVEAIDVVEALPEMVVTEATVEPEVEFKPSPILRRLTDLLEPCFPVVLEGKSEDVVAVEEILEPRRSEDSSITSLDSIIDSLATCDNIASLSQSLERLSQQSKPGSPEARLFAQLQHYAVSSSPVAADDSDKWSTKSGRSVKKMFKKSFSRSTYPQSKTRAFKNAANIHANDLTVVLSSTTFKIKAILPPFLSLNSSSAINDFQAPPTPPPTAPSESLLAEKPSRSRLFPKMTMTLMNSNWLRKSRRSSVSVN